MLINIQRSSLGAKACFFMKSIDAKEAVNSCYYRFVKHSPHAHSCRVRTISLKSWIFHTGVLLGFIAAARFSSTCLSLLSSSLHEQPSINDNLDTIHLTQA